MSDSLHSANDRPVHYVLLRSQGGQDIFRGDADRDELSVLVDAACLEYRVRIHAFCWTRCDARLLVEGYEVAVEQFIQRLASSYTRYFHRIAQSNRAFQDRYWMATLDGGFLLMQLARCIHRVPAAMGLVDHPLKYRWSGHRAYLGLETISWLTTSRILSLFDESPARARGVYERCVNTNLLRLRRDRKRNLAQTALDCGDTALPQQLWRAKPILAESVVFPFSVSAEAGP